MPYILNAKARLKLKHKLHDMCINLCNHLRVNHILIQRGITEKVNKRGKVVGIKPVWDLPVCACYCSANDINAEGYSHRMFKCHQLLENELLKFGNVGKAPSKGILAINHDPWPLGQCAEQHAANRLLYGTNERPTSKGKGRNPGTQFNEIYVGPAYRVKTRQFMPACKNCRAIFNGCYDIMSVYAEDYLKSRDIDWFFMINGKYPIHASSFGGTLPPIINNRERNRAIQKMV